MGNPLKVSLENIIPLTFARDHFSQIVSEVQQDKLFVLTKGGKPAVAIIDVKYLEDISGGHVQEKDISEEIKKDPEKVGLPPMVKHSSTPLGTSPSTSLENTRDKPLRTSPPTPQPPNPTPPPASPNRVEPPKPLDKPPSTPIPRPGSEQVGTSQPKPAGFAAPRPPSPAPSAIDKPQPPQNPPLPKPTPPPVSTPKPEPQPIPKPMPVPPPMKPEPPKPSLVMPQPSPKPAEKTPTSTPIPNKPLTTLPPIGNQNPKPQVDVQFSPDESALQEKSQDGQIPDGEKIAPDDEAPPAQYAGENPPAGGDEEPEDMALD